MTDFYDEPEVKPGMITLTVPSDAIWPERMERLLQGIECWFPGIQLWDWMGWSSNRNLIQPTERIEYLRRTRRTKRRYFSVSDVGFTQSPEEGHFTVGGYILGSPKAPHYTNILTSSKLARQFDEQLLIQAGQACGAFTGCIIPYDSQDLIYAASRVGSNVARDDVRVVRLRAQLPNSLLKNGPFNYRKVSRGIS